MVDINLFDEELEEAGSKNKKEESSPPSFHEAGFDDVGGDFDLGADLGGGSQELGESEAVGDGETLPDFEELDGLADYSSEEKGEKKKVSGVLIGVLGIAILALVFLYVGLPLLQRPAPVKKMSKPVQPRPQVVQPPSAPPIPQPVSPSTQPPTQSAQAEGTFDYLVAAKTVFEQLSGQGEGGLVIIDGNQYLVEYVSKTPGVAKVMGERIQRLLGVDNYEASPEERHMTGGETNYWGVISGTLPQEKVRGGPASPNPFPSVSAFNERIKTLVAQHGMTLEGLESPAGIMPQGNRQASGHWIVSGDKAKALAFLEALNRLEGRWGISKLLIAPLQISDFYATQVKIGVTFWVETG